MVQLDLEDGFNLAIGRQKVEAARCVSRSLGLSPEGPSGDPRFLKASDKVSPETLLAPILTPSHRSSDPLETGAQGHICEVS